MLDARPAAAPTRIRSRAVTLVAAAVLSVGALMGTASPHYVLSATACANPIACENANPGAAASQWSINQSGDSTIQGFATDISVNRGATIGFKISTDASAYTITIYRLGYYGGAGARQVASVTPSARLPQNQPACLSDSSGLVDCGNWATSASWAVPLTAVSGIYIARLQRTDTGGASQVVFIVRDDSSTADIYLQTADTTWQAYNAYGGNSLYGGRGPGSNGRAYKVSYNRPFTTAYDKPESWLFNAEYPMLRWLEANGYDVAYGTGIDSDRNGSLIRNHKVFVSVGHDEYWSAAQRANVESARAAGVNLAFFSGNESFWKTRWENSIDGTATSYRTLVTYKETLAGAVVDPADPPTWTGTWRDPRFSPPADGGRPENSLSGTAFMVNGPNYQPLVIPQADGKMRFWRNTAAAGLGAGQSLTLTTGCGGCLVGYEWNEDLDNGFRPPGLFHLSTTQANVPELLADYGGTYQAGNATHNLTMYRASSGALVFSAGSVGWAYGLDGSSVVKPSAPDSTVQQATVNLLADMRVQPATLGSGLQAAVASTDSSPPSSTITGPAGGSSVPPYGAVTVTGTASDPDGGQVAGVEVSVDGGSSWHPASGRGSWSYSFTVGGSGQASIRSRAVDDSGNIEAPSAGITVNVGGGSCNCIWGDAASPATVATSDGSSVELGLKFQADTSGLVTGARFYKSSSNTGTHVANLWNASGALLASASFSSETASGWQQVQFSSPVSISAGTTYVISYHATTGHYSQDTGFFTSKGVDSGHLHALSSAAAGGNGVYAYAAGSTFPTSTYQDSNYWVDVTFTASTQSGAPPPVTPGEIRTIVNGSTIEVNDGTTFAAIFDKNQSGGLTQLYDLVADPKRTFNQGPQSGYTLFNSYLLDSQAATTGGSWGLLGGASASTFELTRQTAESATIHVIAPYGCEVIESPNCYITDVQSETWTTIYSGGQVFFERHIITGGLAHTLNDVAPASVDLCHCSVWYGIYDGVASDTSYPSGSNVHVGTGIEKWWGTYRQSAMGALEIPYQDQSFGFKYADVRMIVGTAYLRSHVSARTEGGAALPTSTTLAARYRGLLSSNANSATAAAMTADYRAPSITTSAGSVVATDPELSANLTSGYNAGTGRYVLAPDSTGTVAVALNFPTGVSVRYHPAFKILNWTTTGQTVTFNGQPLTYGSDYFASVDGDGALRLNLNFDVVPASPGQNQRVTGALKVGPSGSPLPSAPPTVTATTPASNATNVSVVSRVTATFSKPVTPSTISFTVTPSGGSAISGTISYNSTSQVATFSPAANLVSNTTYAVSLKGAADSSGNVMQPATWSFTTMNCPCSMWTSSSSPGSISADSNAVEVGVKFQSDVPGWIGGIRFYKGSTNTGTHIGTLWSASGTKLATVTFSGETASGWQQASFSTPVQISANTTYIASYHSDVGHYASDSGFFADTGFDSGPLHALSTAAAAGNGVYVYSSTPAFPVNSYGATNYWVDVVLSTTAPPPPPAPAPQTCPCTVFAASTTPATISTDTGSVELGMKFTSDTAGYVTGVRFYKSTANTGTHTGTLWSASGAQLATVTFTNETTSGWQQAAFSTAVAVSANTTYVISYHAPAGRYAQDLNYFAGQVDNAPLHAPASGSSSGNGLYAYASGSTFPTGSYNASNYWVDAVFSTTSPPPTSQTCPCSLFAASATPASISSDSSAVEVGLKFTSERSGQITAVRFYKGVSNTGTHVGSLWDGSGKLLAQVTFTNETSSGWQQVNFSSAVTVNANTSYVVSYHTNAGHYGQDANFFTNGVDNAPLHAPSSSSAGGNGVYAYSASSTFPNNSYQASNYWVDVVFSG